MTITKPQRELAKLLRRKLNDITKIAFVKGKTHTKILVDYENGDTSYAFFTGTKPEFRALKNTVTFIRQTRRPKGELHGTLH